MASIEPCLADNTNIGKMSHTLGIENHLVLYVVNVPLTVEDRSTGVSRDVFRRFLGIIRRAFQQGHQVRYEGGVMVLVALVDLRKGSRQIENKEKNKNMHLLRFAIMQ